ncbi:centromere-associated protein E-like isoform X2 [Dendronephthya gigantea]|uniref:centromere-associated protein E-like isoform X2 n=1 Tax=Dendronephthya gigantea TaxID=151771 RepID=UPI00106D7F0E|nr:centromere-associated protein E-like isoform X2 [Dendronephthya gigantea]
MAATEEKALATLDLIVTHGPTKHAITLRAKNASGMLTVQSLAECIEKELGVPRNAQKLIHKGKSLQDLSSMLISYGIKSGSKIMLIGSKYNLEEDPNYKQLSKIDDSVNELQKQLRILEGEFDNIKQGYLDEKFASESIKKLIKKTKGIIEENMKKIEFVDSLEVDVLLRGRRKNLVIKIQSSIDKADEFIATLNKYYNLEEDPNYKQLSKIDDSVNELQKQLRILEGEFDNIKQGYLDEKFASESIKKLIKKTKGIIEENMKEIEFVDSLEVDVLLRRKRKNLVIKIQSSIDKVDEFIATLNKYYNLKEDPNYKQLSKIDDSVNELQKQLRILEGEFDNIKQGYLDEKFTSESIKKLIRKTKGIIEENMKRIEFVDSLEVDVLLRRRRKNLVIKIQYNLKEDPNYKQLSKIDDSVNELQKQLRILEGEFDNIKQGYLDEKFTLESIKKLIKKTKGIIEENMKRIEFVDSLEVDVLLRRRRKNLVIKIQSSIDKADEFIATLNKYYNLEEDPNYKQLSKIDDSVNELQKQLRILEGEFDNIKQGYLDEKFTSESIKKLIKKTKGVIEENMKRIEFVDSLEVDVLLRRRRKNLVIKIQSSIDRADEFIATLNKYVRKSCV